MIHGYVITDISLLKEMERSNYLTLPVMVGVVNLKLHWITVSIVYYTKKDIWALPLWSR